ncbi:MAG: DUF1275 domain-containing protein [Bacteroidetes bacterium]|nr:DUF1275 domain-containing protein [Bacteroidota bacterium]MBU1373591.1 DUF1275 domain-containing protein [Bacteroidota bacterium]MBU1486402.1 DUF1275 domain-containing protein [Bacteroidota bacterium]MBU1759639.1 DUF1275 domain-containing protein [Bacteroidota bacterium]MBU2045941.1 DUF1275 domain-containing protein [Bacteroidota bacterium]
MFRHTGKNRTFRHNLRLASFLSMVAGIVNISGLLSVHELTTNVTGHFAFFAEKLVNSSFQSSFNNLLFILSFLLGAFFSGIMVEIIYKRNDSRSTIIIPVIFEIIILVTITFLGKLFSETHPISIACSLLFAMGLQNALVTHISKSVVRTTHLTGLFTDLGIELAQLFFIKELRKLSTLKSSIKLRMVIILFFFLGCITGGILFKFTEIDSLFAAAIILTIGLLYDTMIFRYKVLKRNHHLHQ